MGNCFRPCMFLPPPRPSYSFDSLPTGAALVRSRKARIPVVLVRAPGSQGADINSRLTILYSHGNAEDLRGTVDVGRVLAHHTSHHVCVYDYTGYGASTGLEEGAPSPRPSEADAKADIRAAYNYLIDTVGVRAENIVLLGRSLGSGPTCDLAREVQPRGLILIAPLKSVIRVGISWCVCCCCCDPFQNIRKASSIYCPALVIHGTEDRVVPFSHGQALHAALRGAVDPVWIDGAGHNNMADVEPQRYFDAQSNFLALLASGRTDRGLAVSSSRS